MSLGDISQGGKMHLWSCSHIILVVVLAFFLRDIAYDLRPRTRRYYAYTLASYIGWGLCNFAYVNAPTYFLAFTFFHIMNAFVSLAAFFFALCAISFVVERIRPWHLMAIALPAIIYIIIAPYLGVVQLPDGWQGVYVPLHRLWTTVIGVIYLMIIALLLYIRKVAKPDLRRQMNYFIASIVGAVFGGIAATYVSTAFTIPSPAFIISSLSVLIAWPCFRVRSKL